MSVTDLTRARPETSDKDYHDEATYVTRGRSLKGMYSMLYAIYNIHTTNKNIHTYYKKKIYNTYYKQNL